MTEMRVEMKNKAIEDVIVYTDRCVGTNNSQTSKSTMSIPDIGHKSIQTKVHLADKPRKTCADAYNNETANDPQNYDYRPKDFDCNNVLDFPIEIAVGSDNVSICYCRSLDPKLQ
jgi:hypothetical protein